MIEDALRQNFVTYHEGNSVKMAACDYEPRICAIDTEHGIFRSNKLLNIYKVNVMKMTGEIRRMTKDKTLHSSLMPKTFHPASTLTEPNSNSCDNSVSDHETEDIVCDKTGAGAAFTSASELLKERSAATSKPCTGTSANACDTFRNQSADNGNISQPVFNSNVLKRERPTIKYFFERGESEDIRANNETSSDDQRIPDAEVQNVKNTFEIDGDDDTLGKRNPNKVNEHNQ